MKTKIIYASERAALDSNVMTGGGTDDTAAIQAILDEANETTAIHLIMDGAALISQICIHSNTTIECLNNSCGFFQIDHTDCAMVTCDNEYSYKRLVYNVSLLGGTYNQNCLNQAHDTDKLAPFRKKALTNEKEHARDFDLNLCIEFFGIENLLVRDITIRAFRTFAFTVGNFKNVTVENVHLELQHHMNGNQDGFHFWGPGQYLTVRNCGGSVSDDIMNIGPDEMDRVSSITDVLVDGLFLDDAEQAVRLLSRGTGRLDRVTIRNITGQYRSYGFYIDPWFPDGTMGAFGNIFIENVDLKEHKHTYTYHPPVLLSFGGNIECLTLKNFRHHAPIDNRPLFEFGLPYYNTHPSTIEDLEIPEQKIGTVIIDGLTVLENESDPLDTDYITVYKPIDTMILKNIFVCKKQAPNGSLVRFGRDGEIRSLIASEVYTEGVKSLFSDETKVKTKRKSEL